MDKSYSMAKNRKNQSTRIGISSLVLPILFVVAWISALSSTPPGMQTGELAAVSYLRWLLYYAAFALLFASVMHSVFAKRLAASIGWKTNGFQYELAAFSLGAGLACLYAVYHGVEALIAAAIPVCVFLFLAGVNHLREIVKEQNYAPNNTLILIWDFGMSLSLAALLLALF